MILFIFLLIISSKVFFGTSGCTKNIRDYCDDFQDDYNVNSAVALPTTRKKRSSKGFYSNNEELSGRVSRTLDALLSESRYDRQIRPLMGESPLRVSVNVAIRSMGPVDEKEQIFSMDCYFRQYWTDPRLVYNSSKFSELPMNWGFLTKIWRPDTVIINGKNSYLHKMTVPNRFIRISPSGRISYSQRLTVKARCEMDLRKFPLDSQNCPLEIGSFGYGDDEIQYNWTDVPLSMDKKLGLAQYYLIKWNHSNFIRNCRNTGRDQRISIVSLQFTFQRRTGYYLLQIYIPLTLIVCCSWVTFWLVKTEKGGEIPARTSLGGTTVLAIVTIGFGGKSKPRVGYATALDVFIVLCFMTVFAALIEFAYINFIDTLVRKLKKNDELEELSHFYPRSAVYNANIHRCYSRSVSTGQGDELIDESIIPLTPAQVRWKKVRTTVISRGKPSITKLVRQLHFEEMRKKQSRSLWLCFQSIRSFELYKDHYKFLLNVDARSRKYFPLGFFILNLIYWASYIYIF